MFALFITWEGAPRTDKLALKRLKHTFGGQWTESA